MIEQQKYLLRLFAAALLACTFAEAQEEEEKIYQLDEMVIIGENEAISTAAILPQTIDNQDEWRQRAGKRQPHPQFQFQFGRPHSVFTNTARTSSCASSTKSRSA